MKKKYTVKLSTGERQDLKDLVHKGKAAAYRRTHAQMLLLVDEGDDGTSLRDSEVADRVGVNERTVSRLRQRCVEQGLEAALERQPRERENRPFFFQHIEFALSLCRVRRSEAKRTAGNNHFNQPP